MYRHGLGLFFLTAACGGSATRTRTPEPPAPAAVAESCPAPPASSQRTEVATHVVQQHHDGAVLGVRFAPSGRKLATVSADDTLRIWDVPSRALLWQSPERPGKKGLTFVAWADGDHLLVGNSDEAAVVEGTTWRPLGRGYRDAVRIPDGTAAVWAGSACDSQRGKIELLDRTGRVVGRLGDSQGGTSCITTFAIARDGTSISGVLSSGRAIRWRLPHEIPSTPIEPVEATQLGSNLATEASTLDHAGDLLVAAPQRTGFVLASAAIDGKEDREYDLPLGDEMRFPVPPNGGDLDHFDHGDRWINDLATSPDGTTVFAAAGVYLMAFDSRTHTRVFRESAATRMTANDRQPSGLSPYYWLCHGYYCSTDVSGDNRLLAVGTHHGRVHLYDARSRRWIGELGASAPRPEELRFAGEDLLAVRSGGTISVWSLATARPIVSREPAAWVSQLRVDNGHVVIFGQAADPRCGPGIGAIRYETWNTPAPREGTIDRDPNRTIVSRCQLVGNAGAADMLDDVSPAHSLAIVTRYTKDTSQRAGVVKQSRVIDLATGRELQLEAIANEENHLIAGKRRRLSPDARWVFDVVTDPITPSVAVWEVATGKLVKQLTYAGASWMDTNAAWMSPDSNRIAIGNRDHVDIVSLPDLAVVAANQPTADLAKLGFGPGTVAHAHWMAQQNDQREARTAAGVTAKALADGSIEVADARGVRAKLVMFDDAEWEIVTPKGAYTGSFEVAGRVGWRFDDPVEVFNPAQFASKFERPDIVARRLAGDPGDLDVAIHHRPPRVSVTNTTVTGGRASLAIDVASTGQVDSIGVSVEGRLVERRRICAGHAQVTIDVPVAAGTNRVTVIAFDSDGYASNPVSLDVAGAATTTTRPTLHLLTIGVGRYPNLAPESQLPAASHDGADLVAAFERATRDHRIYGAVRSKTLTDEAATVPSVLAALDELATIAPDDVAIVAMAGHGVELEPGRMVMLTAGATAEPASWQTHGIDWSAVRERLAKVRGRVVLLLDACHSGAFNRERLVQNDALASQLVAQNRTGVIVLAASKGAQLAYEGDLARALRTVARTKPVAKEPGTTVGRGVFADAIIDALADPASDLDGDGMLQLSELVEFVTAQVDQKTSGYQTPWLVRREVFGDFSLATVTPPPPPPTPKPVDEAPAPTPGDPFLRDLAADFYRELAIPAIASGSSVGCLRLAADGTITSTHVQPNGSADIDIAVEHALAKLKERRTLNPVPVPVYLLQQVTTRWTCFNAKTE